MTFNRIVDFETFLNEARSVKPNMVVLIGGGTNEFSRSLEKECKKKKIKINVLDIDITELKKIEGGYLISDGKEEASAYPDSTIIVGSGTYSVIGTNQYGCTDSKSVTVSLNSFAAPTLNVSVSCINGATFTWNSSTCFSRYDVRQKLTTSTSWTTYNNVVSEFKKGLSGGLREAQIRVYVNGVAQSWSSSVQFNYPNYLLQLQPPTFTITQLSPSSVKVDYVVNPLLPTTNLRLKKVVNTSWTNVTVSGGTYTRNNMTANSQYEFQMRCTCSGQIGLYSPSTYFSTVSALRVENITNDNLDVTVFPNPFKNTLNVVSDSIGYITVLNLQGSLIDVQVGNNVTIDTKNYLPGIYLLEFKTKKNERASFKIIKSN